MDRENNSKAPSRRELFRRAIGAATVTSAAASPLGEALAAPESIPAPVVIGREAGMDFYKSQGREAFAYSLKDGNLAIDGFAGKRWVMLIDLRKCVGCQACTVACKFENNIPEGSFRTWVPDVEIGVYPYARRAFLPRLCNHCERPSCIEVCPADATWQRKDGIVEIDYDKCWGCGSCVNACPYDARFINPVTKTADKCTFCSQRVDQGLLPACVETCIGGARQFGDLNDPDDLVARQIKTEAVQTLKPSTGNQPRVFYIGLPDALQNNFPGRPTLWSEMFEEAGFRNPESETAGEWKIRGKTEADHG